MKSLRLFFLIASIYCWVNFSAVVYKTVFSGYFFLISIPIAFARWVFPKPTPPKIRNGLKDVPPGLFETASPAFLASRFESPSKKFSNV